MLWGLLCRSLADVQSPQERHDLRSRAVVVGAEQVTADAAGMLTYLFLMISSCF